jgi:uncharacterized protein (TIGR03083 family)
MKEEMDMSTAPPLGLELRGAVAAEYLDLATILEAGPRSIWDAPSLCAGWRTREVVAHLTMPIRYTPPRYMQELAKTNGDFNAMADSCAKQDAAILTQEELVAALRDPNLHAWQPPGGGYEGALTHVVIHGLDITVSQGLERRVPEVRLHKVLQVASSLESLMSNVSGVELRASDLDWSFGAGSPVLGRAQDLALVLFGRRLPAGRLQGESANRFTAA